MALENLSPEQIIETNIPTGIPFGYIIDAQGNVVQKLEDLTRVEVPTSGN
jgi:bisphosphoglycerate-dependent phosphoglycerate mutase